MRSFLFLGRPKRMSSRGQSAQPGTAIGGRKAVPSSVSLSKATDKQL